MPGSSGHFVLEAMLQQGNSKQQSNPSTDPNSRSSLSQLEPTLEWLDLRNLTRYASVSRRTLQEWLHRVSDPLPASQVDKKILVSRKMFDQWLARHPFRPAEAVDIDRLLDDIVGGLRQETA
jgi:site-specific recombinase XerD